MINAALRDAALAYHRHNAELELTVKRHGGGMKCRRPRDFPHRMMNRSSDRWLAQATMM
jgi:hypothetical protein